MVQFKNEIVIEKPLEEVFSLMAQGLFENLPQREDHTTLLIEQLTDGPIGQGTQFRIISAREEVEPDPAISEFLRGLDLDLLESDLHKQLKESFVGISAFEKNKLLELILISDEDKALTRFHFKKVKEGTKIEMSFQFEVRVKGHKIFSFFANRLIDYIVKKFDKPEFQQEFKERFESGLDKLALSDTVIEDDKRES